MKTNRTLKTIRQYRSSFIVLAMTFAVIVSASLLSTRVTADPCGMVPPIYEGQSPIVRTGLQQTFVFYRDGVESFVIRPGYEGKIDNFGMLIPFPTPPSIRKVHDEIFGQIENAVDPPEVVVDLNPVVYEMMPHTTLHMDYAGGLAIRDQDSVQVIKEEAVGMYEVAVLAAGSANALKKWMDENGYQFPEGMDAVTEEYIAEEWCFVAVKTKVAAKDGVDPQPGQREIHPGMPESSIFEGNVQGLGFRFRTDELVVPMRLSAFNEGELRNVVYLLTDSPKRIRNIPEEYVRRQISGNQLAKNITEPLPLRVLGGTINDIPAERMERLKTERNPEPHNGIAARLFISDILASEMDKQKELILEDESSEKTIVTINERLGLRGIEVDNLVVEAMNQRFEADERSLAMLREMTLTVVDGDFPREVLAGQNLTFDNFQMAAGLNNAQFYDSKIHKGTGQRVGRLYFGALQRNSNPESGPTQTRVARITQPASNEASTPRQLLTYGVLFGLLVVAFVCSGICRRGRTG